MVLANVTRQNTTTMKKLDNANIADLPVFHVCMAPSAWRAMISQPLVQMDFAIATIHQPQQFPTIVYLT